MASCTVDSLKEAPHQECNTSLCTNWLRMIPGMDKLHCTHATRSPSLKLWHNIRNKGDVRVHPL
jgi:hypothetical protein